MPHALYLHAYDMPYKTDDLLRSLEIAMLYQIIVFLYAISYNRILLIISGIKRNIIKVDGVIHLYKVRGSTERPSRLAIG